MKSKYPLVLIVVEHDIKTSNKCYLYGENEKVPLIYGSVYYILPDTVFWISA